MSEGYFIWKLSSFGPRFLKTKQFIKHSDPFITITGRKKQATVFKDEAEAIRMLDLFKRVDKSISDHSAFKVSSTEILQLI